MSSLTRVELGLKESQKSKSTLLSDMPYILDIWHKWQKGKKYNKPFNPHQWTGTLYFRQNIRAPLQRINHQTRAWYLSYGLSSWHGDVSSGQSTRSWSAVGMWTGVTRPIYRVACVRRYVGWLCDRPVRDLVTWFLTNNITETSLFNQRWTSTFNLSLQLAGSHRRTVWTKTGLVTSYFHINFVSARNFMGLCDIVFAANAAAAL